jgi:hypothetical protein
MMTDISLVLGVPDEGAILAALADYFYPDPIPGYDEYLHRIASTYANTSQSLAADNRGAGPFWQASAPASGRGFSAISVEGDDKVLPTASSAPAPGRGFAASPASPAEGVLPAGAPAGATPQGSPRTRPATSPETQIATPTPKIEPESASAPQQPVLQRQWFGAPSPEETLAAELSLAREIQKSVLEALAHRAGRKGPADGITPAAAPNASDPANPDHTVAVAVSVSGVGAAISIATADGEMDPVPASAPAPRTTGQDPTGHGLADLNALPQGAPAAGGRVEGHADSRGVTQKDYRRELPDFAGTPLPERNLSSAEMQAYLLALSGVATQEKGVGPNPTLTAVGVSQELASAARSLWLPWAIAPAHAPAPGPPAALAPTAAFAPLVGSMLDDAGDEPEESPEDLTPDTETQATASSTIFPEETAEVSASYARAPAPESGDMPDGDSPATANAPAVSAMPDPAAQKASDVDETIPVSATAPAPSMGPSDVDELLPVPASAPALLGDAASAANGGGEDVSISATEPTDAPSPLSGLSAIPSPDVFAVPQNPAPAADTSLAPTPQGDSLDSEDETSGFADAIKVLDRSSSAASKQPVDLPEPLFAGEDADATETPALAPPESRTPVKAPSTIPSDAEHSQGPTLAPTLPVTPVPSLPQLLGFAPQASPSGLHTSTDPQISVSRTPAEENTRGAKAPTPALHVRGAVASTTAPLPVISGRTPGFTASQALRLLGLTQLEADRIALAAANGILAQRRGDGVPTHDISSVPAAPARTSRGIRQAG